MEEMNIDQRLLKKHENEIRIAKKLQNEFQIAKKLEQQKEIDQKLRKSLENRLTEKSGDVDTMDTKKLEEIILQ